MSDAPFIRVECPDCKKLWNLREHPSRCPECGLSRDDLETAAEWWFRNVPTLKDQRQEGE